MNTVVQLPKYCRAAVLALILTATLSTAQTVNEVPSYQPRAVPAPTDASYILADGSIYLAGNAEMEAMLSGFNELFIKTHAAFRVKLLAQDSSTALGGLTAGVVAFALIDRAAWSLEVRPFRQLYGYEPIGIHIGRVGYSAPGRVNPPAIYVNARNPLHGVTVEQVTRIFTTGGGQGDLAKWSQLGLRGDWADRVIHVYGPRDDGGFATAMRHERMGGFPFTRRYEPLAKDPDIIDAVRDDPYGIALVGFFDSKDLPHEVKMLPLAEKELAPYSKASYQDVVSGKYPYTPYLHLYVNRTPGKPLDPFVKEYARLILSREGQAIIGAQKNISGYVPLSAREVAEELAKLE